MAPPIARLSAARAVQLMMVECSSNAFARVSISAPPLEYDRPSATQLSSAERRKCTGEPQAATTPPREESLEELATLRAIADSMNVAVDDEYMYKRPPLLSLLPKHRFCPYFTPRDH
eukprot:2946481-Prymnesium_polylepis.1